jgi:hypothetical protein
MADAIPLNRPSKARAGAVASADERLAFERLLVDLSSQFANAAGDQFEIVTPTALSRILEFLGFDRSTFGEFLENGSIDVLASSAIEGVVPMPFGNLSLDFVWYHRKLRAGEMIVLQSLPDDLPPEAVAEAEYCRSIGFRAHVSIPISVGGRFSGFLSFGS